MEGLCERALEFLIGELGATRAVVLHEDDPDQDFEVIASRGLDAEGFWRDPNIDFSVLSSVCSSGLPENRRNHLLCAPGRDRNGRVVALLYADRPREPFGIQALTALAEYVHHFEEELSEVHVTRTKTRAKTMSKVGGANTRVAFLLAEQGLVTLDQGEQALLQAESTGQLIERVLVDSGRLREEDILRALASYYQLEPWVVNLEQVSPDVARLLPLDRARILGAIPIGLSRDHLAVALALPDNAPALHELRRLSGRDTIVRLVGRLGFERILEALAGLDETAPPPPPRPATEKLLAGRYRVSPMPLLVCRFSSLLNAVDVETGQSVVLRRLEPPSQDKAQARSQTLGEGRRMSQLDHLNLPKVERVLEEEDQVYLVLEDFSGPTLEQLVIQHGPVPAHTLPKLIDQLMAVLDYLHSQEPPIIHRDLRPEVVILTPDATIKLAEFGLAKMHADVASAKTSFRAHGSPHYASPEQLLGEPSHPRQDLYSLGAILYYLATGSPPGKSLERCFNEAVAGTLPGLPADFPHDLGEFISRLLETDGEKRPGRVSEARAMLQQLVVPPPLPPPRSRGARTKITLETPPNGGVRPAEVASEETLELLLGQALEQGVTYLHIEAGGAVRGRRPGGLEQIGGLGAAQVEAFRQATALGDGPGGAQIPWKVGSQEVSLRVSTLGEHLVVRLLVPDVFTRTLADLGMADEAQGRLRSLLSPGHGVVLAAGPGCTTTLYACLRELHRPERCSVTLEDPIKYRLPGVVQALARPAAFRELWHQDPDLVLLGDVPDDASARAASHVALRGATVLAAVRCADALSALARWTVLDGDLARLQGSLGQRLTRRLCADCRHEVPVSSEHQATFERYRIPQPKEYAARGCPACQQTGYRGQLGVFEVVAVTPEIRAVLGRSPALDELRRAAAGQGFQPLLQDGLSKVSAGLTTFDELLRVCR